MPKAESTDEESRYATVSDVLPTYAAVTKPAETQTPPESEYEVVDELHVREEEKKDLGALEKQETKESEPAEDDPKQANLKEYQRLDDI